MVFFDSWDNEFFIIKIDGVEVYREQSYYTYHTKLCGKESTGDRVHDIEFEISHSSD